MLHRRTIIIIIIVDAISFSAQKGSDADPAFDPLGVGKL
jgi:hypothetical protein